MFYCINYLGCVFKCCTIKYVRRKNYNNKFKFFLVKQVRMFELDFGDIIQKTNRCEIRTFN